MYMYVYKQQQYKSIKYVYPCGIPTRPARRRELTYNSQIIT